MPDANRLKQFTQKLFDKALQTSVAPRRGPAVDPRTGRLRSCSPLKSLLLDIDALLAKHGRKRASSDAMVGKKTLFDRRKCLYRLARSLHERGMKLRRLDNLRCDHVQCLIDGFRHEQLKPATVGTYLSHLRRLCDWLGKPQLVRYIDEQVVAAPELVSRPSVAESDKSLSAFGLNVLDVMAQAIAVNEHFACQLALMWALGLRAQEAWMFCPRIAETSDRTFVVSWGTKGGRCRKLPPVLGEKERAVTVWAATLVTSEAGWMIPPPFTLKKWRGRFYRLTRKVGLTRADLCATPHALRHERLNMIYEWLTGSESPVRGGCLRLTDPQADRDARRIVAEFAGHSRVHASSAYLGAMRARNPSHVADEVGSLANDEGVIADVKGADEPQQ